MGCHRDKEVWTQETYLGGRKIRLANRLERRKKTKSSEEIKDDACISSVGT